MRLMTLFEALLRLYPASFRSEYGDELRRWFRDRSRDTRGFFPALGLWLEAGSDTFVNAAGVHWDYFRQDFRYTGRILARSPGFAATAVLVASLGIGATTAVFSIMDHVLIRPLRFADPEKIVKLWESPPGYSRTELSPANYRDWRQMASSFETMAAYHFQHMNLVGRGEPLRLRGVAVTGNLFPMLGVEPIAGRYLDEEDVRPGAPDALVIGYGLWQNVFGGQPVVGTTVRLEDAPYTIVGVMPPDFIFPNRQIELWMAKRFRNEDFEDRDNNYLYGLAKLGPGVSLDEARAEMAVVTERLEQLYPEENERTGATVIPLRDDVSPQSRLLLAALAGASLCVLLIACTNLANLLIARAMERRKELTVRAAMGAGRERLARQLVTESLVLAFLGGLIGVAAAWAGVPWLERLVPSSLPIGEATAVAPRVIAFAALVTCATGLGFGVLPALRSCRGGNLGELREGVRSTVGARRQRLRSALVVFEVAATVVLLIASGLLVRALLRVQAVDPGFRTHDVLALHTPLPPSKYVTTARRAELYETVLSEVRALPGVAHAAFVSFLPMEMGGGIWPVEVEGITQDSDAPEKASLRFVTAGFFSTLGIPLQLGRDVSESDDFERPFVAVVSESFARRYWPDADPLGKRFQFAFRERTVVGVVGNIHVRGLERSSEPQVYLPHRQVPDGSLVFYMPKELVIHSTGDPETLVAPTRAILREAEPELPVGVPRTLEDVVRAELAPRATQVRVLLAFAALSVLLSSVGIYGLLSFAVSQRRAELGLRIALGARWTGILSMVVGEGALLAALGAGSGIALGFVAGRAMEAILFGVEPGDTATYVIAGSLALLMTLAGSLVPAVRALRVDPTEALRAG